jgi:hypothetical protein
MEVNPAISEAITQAVRAVACRRAAVADKGSAHAWTATAEYCSSRSREALGGVTTARKAVAADRSE